MTCQVGNTVVATFPPVLEYLFCSSKPAASTEMVCGVKLFIFLIFSLFSLKSGHFFFFFKLQKFLETLSWDSCYWKLIFYTRKVLLDLTSVCFSSHLYMYTSCYQVVKKAGWTIGRCGRKFKATLFPFPFQHCAVVCSGH